MRQRWRRKPNHSRTHLPRGKAKGSRNLWGERYCPSRGVCFFPSLTLRCQAGGSGAHQWLEMGWWDGVTCPFCPPELPVPWCGALLGWPRSAWLLPSPWSPAGHPTPSPLSFLAQVLECPILPRDPSPFFLQQLSELNRFIFCPSQFTLWWY